MVGKRRPQQRRIESKISSDWIVLQACASQLLQCWANNHIKRMNKQLLSVLLTSALTIYILFLFHLSNNMVIN